MENTMIQNTEKNVRTNEEFARNYKVATQDGIYGPVAVGNINEYDGRLIINLCMKTIRSGERNATYSQPVDWRLKAGTGEYVNVLVQNGYVTKIMPIVPKSLSSEVAKSIEYASMGEAAVKSAQEIISEAAKSETKEELVNG
jgi:hypothetical protein